MAEHETLTVRFPAGLLDAARQVKGEAESLNDFVVAAVRHEVIRRQAENAHRRIVQLRERIKARTGKHFDSVPMIRALREGEHGHHA